MAEDVVTPVSIPPVQRKFKLSKSWLWAALFIILLAIAGGVIWHVRNHQIEKRNDAFVINGKQYSKTDVKAITSFVVGRGILSQSQAASELYSMLKTQAAAQEVKIIPTATEVNTIYATEIHVEEGNPMAAQWYQLQAFISALPEAYAQAEQGGYAGDVFVFEFGLRVQATIHPSIVPGYGNATLIAQDRAYASQQANNYYSLYKAHKITANSLILTINNNSRIAYDPVSGPFNTNGVEPLQAQVGYPSIVSFIQAQTGTGLSAIQVGQVSTSLNPNKPSSAPGFYFFIDLTKASKLISNPQQTVQTAENKLQAVYYGL